MDPGCFSGFGSALPFDAGYRAKPAVGAIVKAFFRLVAIRRCAKITASESVKTHQLRLAVIARESCDEAILG